MSPSYFATQNAISIIESNIAPNVDSRILGRSKSSTTMDIYGHLIPIMHEEIGNQIDAWLTPIPVQMEDSVGETSLKWGNLLHRSAPKLLQNFLSTWIGEPHSFSYLIILHRNHKVNLERCCEFLSIRELIRYKQQATISRTQGSLNFPANFQLV